VLSLAHGVAPNAGDTVIVVRGTRRGDASSPSVDVNLKQLLESADPSANVVVHPGDSVKVPAAPLVYVVGEVKKPGAFPMGGNQRLTVLRAIALGEGLAPTAAKGDAMILRTHPNGEQQEIALRLDRIMKADEPDPQLLPSDVLFIPGSAGKAAARTTLEILARMIRPF
jgi:polysaccharide export outer membrane protein